MSIFGSLLENEGMYRASTIVEDLMEIRDARPAFGCSSPSMLFGSAGAFNFGMMELLYGPKSSGKTMIALDRIKHVLAVDPEMIAIFVDAEMGFEFASTIRWMEANGVDTKRVLIIREVCIKKIFEQKLLKEVQLAIKNEGVKVGIVVIDSVQAMSVLNVPMTDKQIAKAATDKGSVTKQDYGARANYLARIFPFYRKFCRDYQVFTTFIGQARVKGVDVYGNTVWDTNGGEALYHEVQYRTLVTTAGESKDNYILDDKGKKIGHKVRFKYEKNKSGPGQDRTGECDIIYMQGIVHFEEELVSLATDLGIIKRAGAWFNYKDLKGQGTKGMADELRANPDICDDVYSQIIEASKL